MLRRWATSAVAVFAIAIVVAAAAALGSRIDHTRALPRLPGEDPTARYTRDAIGALAPVSAQFARELLGPSGPPAATSDSAPPRERGPSPEPRPEQTIRGTPGPVPGIAPGGWVLAVRMVPDRSEVRAGEEIHYRVIVTNTGTGEFRGRSFTLEWHTPTGTVGRNALDQCSLIPLSILQAACAAQRIAVSPGFGDDRHDRFTSSGLITIDPNESFTRDWYVQVLPSATVGTTYVTHAHLTVTVSGRSHTVSSGDAVVTVVA